MSGRIIPFQMNHKTELLAVSDARQRILDKIPNLETQEIPLDQVVDRYLAEPIRAQFAFPLFDNSAMDGFAIRAENTLDASHVAPVSLNVVTDIPAGSLIDAEIQDGEAARIMTGAVIPTGANAVVPVELTDFNFRQVGLPPPAQIQVYRQVETGANIRRSGEDIEPGATVLVKGQRIRPQDAGLMSMLGISNVRVSRKPKVAILSSGDELLPVGAPLVAGKIYDANMSMLVGLAEKAGAETINLGIVPDNSTTIRQALKKAIDLRVDMILSSAGVSVGALDFIRSVLEQDGKLEFWRVNMRPGKPVAFGHYMNCPFIGLPGNPVSAFIGFEVFVRPAIIRMQGSHDFLRASIGVKLEEEVRSDGRETFLRAVISTQNGELVARLAGHQGSGNLLSLVQANALLLIPSGVKSLPSGGQVEAWLLDGFE